ncbi:hypothetical protein NDU88_008452 [Pleurodeles waltl]|uniref:Uncharacterized protein n=1 Tax=Pleurodeles waltl TaxID=8319 RepID=A0AAV7QPY0_PLEWA|nr:hypothetical protein NDU88_008452 [Pleurodeles waltl]
MVLSAIASGVGTDGDLDWSLLDVPYALRIYIWYDPAIPEVCVPVRVLLGLLLKQRYISTVNKIELNYSPGDQGMAKMTIANTQHKVSALLLLNPCLVMRLRHRGPVTGGASPTSHQDQALPICSATLTYNRIASVNRPFLIDVEDLPTVCVRGRCEVRLLPCGSGGWRCEEGHLPRLATVKGMLVAGLLTRSTPAEESHEAQQKRL